MHQPGFCLCPLCIARLGVQDDENTIRRSIRQCEQSEKVKTADAGKGVLRRDRRAA